MIYRLLIKYLFLFLLCGMLPAGCERDIHSDFPEKIPEELPEGAIRFDTDGSVQTKSLQGGNLTADSWDAVDVSLDDSLLTSAARLSPASQEAGVSGVNASALSPGTSSGISTRGIPVPGTTPPPGSLGVLGYQLTGGIWNSATATPDFMYNTQLIRTGSSGSYSYTYYPPRYWPDDTSDKVRFFAYYPYNGNGISLSSAYAKGYPTITYTPGTNVADQVDLMYASTDAVNNKESGSAVNFSLVHALTRISFSARVDPDLVDATVVIQSVEMKGLKSSGTLSPDPSAATPWTPGAGTASYTASVSNGTLIPAANQSFGVSDYLPVTTPSGYLMLLPQEVTTADTVVVAYTVDGMAKKTTYKLAEATWSMGQSINYQLTIPPLPTANCYILAPGTSIAIKVNVKGNGGDVAGTGLNPTHTASSVSLLWQTESGLITVGTFDAARQKVTLTASGSTGNGVIAALDGGGNVLWSWHIWVTDYDPNAPSNGAVYTYNDRTWMDRNLGATTVTEATVTTLGLLYQWGRKDPFPGSASVSANSEPVGTPVTSTNVIASSNLSNTILHPTTFYWTESSSNNADWYSSSPGTRNDALWGGASTTAPTSKTIFDPCPDGWRVPAWNNGLSPWNGVTAATFPWSSYGRVLYTSTGNTYYPATGQRASNNNGYLTYVGTRCNNWSATPGINTGAPFGNYLRAFDNEVSTEYNAVRALGYSVRCVREK